MSIAEILDHIDYGPAPESDKEARAWLAKHAETRLFIDGGWRAPEGRTWVDTVDPSTGGVPARGARAGPARARHLYAPARLIQRHSRLFAVLESLDNGKPIRETRDIDIPLVARHFYHHAGWAQLMATELPDRVPVGVCGQIIPW